MREYDYIILGGGASGLSLAFQMMQHDALSKSKVLIIDKEQKVNNDRTWCYWEKNVGYLDDIVSHKWSSMAFKSDRAMLDLDLSPYYYKMIRSADFYKKMHSFLSKFNNVEFVTDSVNSISENKVTTDKGSFIALKYIFNSIPNKPSPKHYDHSLIQHFKGYFISISNEDYDRLKPILMDFDIPQTYGCDFVYVLPLEKGKLLVEYTSFSKKVLEDYVYDDFLNNYLNTHLNLTEYHIDEKEFGTIPMTTEAIPKRNGHFLINIGVAGGNAKPSTGYTFTFIQKYVKNIAENLSKNRDPLHNISSKHSRFSFYDAILLRVIKEKKIPARDLFYNLFKKLPPHLVFTFLDEETNFWDEFKIRNTMPQLPFIKAAIQESISLLKRM